MKPDLTTMTVEELTNAWKAAKERMEEVYQKLRLNSQNQAEHNRLNYVRLTATPEGRREHEAICAQLDATRNGLRQIFDFWVAECQAIKAEMVRRGEVLP